MSACGGKVDMLMALTLALQRIWAACRAESRPSGDVTPTSRARRGSVCDRPDLGQFPKLRRVGAIRLPDWTGGIAPQVHRARLLKAAIEATTVKLLEYVATFDCVEIETEHRRPRLQEIALPVGPKGNNARKAASAIRSAEVCH